MNKNLIKKLSSAVIAALLLGTSATPVFAATISTQETDEHTYKVYQIFTGDYSEGGDGKTLSNLKWGANGTGTKDEAVSEDILTEISGLTGSDADKVKAISKYAKLDSAELTTVAAGSPTADLATGYYILVDDSSTAKESDSYSLHLIQVLGEDLVINPKKDQPTFDKDVLDNDLDDDGTEKEQGATEKDLENNNDGWGETADHEIGETFQFRLTAEIPNNEYMDAYETYFVQFSDTFSEGITFESIDSVKVTIGDTTITLLDTDYKLEGVVSGVETDGKGEFTLTIEDLKKITTDIKGAKIEVIYSAHLNSDAVVGNDDSNKNTGKLIYSNNPNSVGDGQEKPTGETPEDTVFVFTYDFEAVKVNEKEGSEKVTLEVLNLSYKC